MAAAWRVQARDDSDQGDHSPFVIAFGIVVVAACLAIALARVAAPLNLDVAWLLYLSERTREGARLYVDLIEVNPPLIVWLGMPAILLERVTGLPHSVGFPLMALAVSATGVAASFRIGRELVAEAYRAPLLGALALALFVVPYGDWGQREHLMLALVLPYVFAAAARRRGLPVRHPIALGLSAGIGLALKPHFVLVFIAIEVWVLLARREVWRGTLTVAAVLAVYGVAVLVLTPAYVPMMLELGPEYRAFRRAAVPALIGSPGSVVALLGLACALVPGEGRDLRRALGVAVLAWWLIAIIQGKGLSYHFVPATAGAVLLFVVALIGAGSIRRSAKEATVGVILMTGAASAITVASPPRADSRFSKIEEVSAATGPGPVLILSRQMADVWPAVSYAGSEWTLPTPFLWLLSTTERGERIAAGHVVDALAEQPVVLVTNRARYDPTPRLNRYPAFRAAWAGYVQTDSTTHYRVFRARQRGQRAPFLDPAARAIQLSHRRPAAAARSRNRFHGKTIRRR